MLPASLCIGSENPREQFPDCGPQATGGWYALGMPTRSFCLCMLVLFLALLPMVSGCAGAGLRRPSGSLVTQSSDGSKAVAPTYTTAVHAATDVAAAEVYLTDLPIDRVLDPRDDLSGLSGSLVQIRLFIVPRAGSTPIGDTACNITMRHVVLSASSSDAAPEIGVYGGGGFLLPSGEPGDTSLSGSMAEVTLRLLDSTSGFVDLLGPAEAFGSFTSKDDVKTVRGLSSRLQRLLARAESPAPDQSTSIASPKE